MKHKHAELIAQYAQDAMETETPWLRWETKCPDYPKWITLYEHPKWADSREYRRKPKIININGFEVPKPERDEPPINTFYYFPTAFGADSFQWGGDCTDKQVLKNGCLHLTRENAQKHAEALISFTKR